MPTIKEVGFYFFALLTLAPAVVVVTTKNIVYAALALMLTLFGVAGLYVFLSADFLAAVQVMLYVGGILVLILFGVMMTSGKLVMKLRMERGQLIPGLVAALVILGLLLLVTNITPWKVHESTTESPPSTAGIGKLIMGEYLLPFEVASVLLLAALIGAVLISRKEVKK